MPSTPNLALKPLVIYGAAGHAKVVFDIVEKQGIYQILSVLDRYKPTGTPCGTRLVSGTMEDLPEMARVVKSSLAPGAGKPAERRISANPGDRRQGGRCRRHEFPPGPRSSAPGRRLAPASGRIRGDRGRRPH